MSGKSFIEVDFPVKEVSAESAREKKIRHGHISTLHIWWARRPLAASRATIYAALTPEPKNEKEREERKKFIAQLCKWENSNDKGLIEKARKDILEANKGVPPRILDPFAGGGAIPLEALRLGCETYASDLNPVAVLIEKATLEYPQKYGKPKKVKADNLEGEVEINPLLDDVKRWGEWVLNETRKEIDQFYPPDTEGNIPIGYIWARTVQCLNPNCGAEIPLLRQTWLAKKDKRKVALKIEVDRRKMPPNIEFVIKEGSSIDFDPSEGTISRANVVCPACSSGIDNKSLGRESWKHHFGESMVAVVLYSPSLNRRMYRLPTDRDRNLILEAAERLDAKEKQLQEDFQVSLIPDEFIYTPDGKPYTPIGTRYVFTPILYYGLTRWQDLFNLRQTLSLITLASNTKRAYEYMLHEGLETEYAKTLLVYLSLAFDRTLTFSSTLTRWKPDAECPVDIYARQALPMTWDYTENNPVESHSGAYIDQVERVLYSLSKIGNFEYNGQISQASALSLQYEDGTFDAIFTDPPYYDNVPYSDLSDFFYVWLKRILNDTHPELFQTPLTPKRDEIISNLSLLRGMSKVDANSQANINAKDKDTFQSMISTAFKEMCRILKPDGVACIVFAHKSTDAWESIINALLDSGLYMTASWPINTEMQARLRAKESAALASSIYMVCRKRREGKVAYFNEIKAGIEKRIHDKLDQFWEEGIGGSDFFISAIGPAVEIFGKYERVEKLSGEQVMAAELLEYVRKVVSEYALSRILDKPQLGGIDIEARFYLLWRWTYNNAKLPFDDARKLSQAVGIELDEYWNKGFIKKDKEFIRVLSANERGSNFLKPPPANMVDVLHQALLLWTKNDRKAISELLSRTGNVANDDFWRLAQAIAEVLPEGDREKQMLQGFLYGKENYAKAGPVTSAEQASLFE